MKKTVYLIFFTSILCLNLSAQNSQSKAVKEIQKFQNKLNNEFLNREKSPLTQEDFIAFKGLNFFKLDLKYRIKATFIKNQFPVPFSMLTTTERKPLYQKYGTLHFVIDGIKCELTVFQNLDLMKKEEYKNYLFVPFTDPTNGNETYGGGRYLDLELPLTNQVLLDFNQSYNPYCAYNGKYSCPIVPKENNLQAVIKAGVLKYH